MDSDALIRAVARLSREATGDASAESLLHRLCEAARIAMPVDGAGVMQTDHRGNTFVHALPEMVAPLELLQEVLPAGPGAEAAQTGVTVIIDSPADLERWPEFAVAAARIGIEAVLAVPLMSRGICWGVLDLYRFSSSPWSPRDHHIAEVLADVSASFLVMGADRDTSRRALAEVVRLSRHDGLTGLPNRTVLYEQLDEALADATRSGLTFAAIFIDLDRFKSINDTFGHSSGDAVLEQVARRLLDMVRPGDSLARLGGDEFVYLARASRPGVGPPSRYVSSVIARLRHAFDAPIVLGEVDISVSASMGATITDGNSTGREVLANADHAMYAAKRQGRGSTVVRDETRTDHVGYTRQLRRDLVAALPNQELVVHYQPIVGAEDPGTVVAVEALLRWARPIGSMVPAAAFIDAAERSGLIVSFGHWLVEQTCAQLRLWIDRFADRAPRTVYLNFSALELADAHLSALLAATLEKYALVPAQIGIEIVEDNLADADIAHRLRRLRGRGHPLAVDDFGTGYSSLSRLVDLPVDLIKIDRSFVSGIPHDARRMGVIDAILNIAHALTIQIIAEGVETVAQQQHLTDAGAHLLQGYLLGRPQSAAELEERLAAQASPTRP